MPRQLRVARLFEKYETALGLRWISSPPPVADAVHAARAESVGHMNLIRPNTVQVLGAPEVDYCLELSDSGFADMTARLFAPATACVVVADALAADERLKAAAVQTAVPLIGASASSAAVVRELHHYLAHLLAERASAHGVFLEILGIGVLLAGDPGVGKSELALELLSRGHRLIADDSPEFRRVTPNTIEGTCPPTIRDFMEVRGLGILNVRALFGDTAVKPRRSLRLVIRLRVMDGEVFTPTERLEGVRKSFDVLGVRIPEIALPVAPGHNLAVLVECSVRNYLSRINGYDAAKEFTAKQKHMLESRHDPDE